MSPRTTLKAHGLAGAAVLIGAGLIIAGCDDQVVVRGSTQPVTGTSQATKPVPVPYDRRHFVPGQRELKDTPFERAWDLPFPRPVIASWISPHIPNLMLFELDNNTIYGVDAFSGNTRWVTEPFPKRVHLTPDITSVKSPDGKGGISKDSDDRVWLVSDDVLYSLDAIYGQIIWRYELPFSPSTGPAALGNDHDQRVFLGDWDNRLQVATFHPDKHFPYILWQMNLHSQIVSKPVELEKRVYAADLGGTVHCFDYDRIEVWKFETGAAISDSPLVRARELFVGNADSALFAINRFTGEHTGKIYLNGSITRAPFAYTAEPHRVYVWTSDKGRSIYGLSAIKTMDDNIPFPLEKDRRPLEVERMGLEWYVPDVDRLVGSTPDYLFATMGKSTLVKAINRASGHVDWCWDANEDHRLYRDERGNLEPREATFLAQYQDPTNRNQSIYTADETGHVIAYRIYGDKPGDPLGGDRQRTARANKVVTDSDSEDSEPALPAKHPKPADGAAPADGTAPTGDAKPADGTAPAGDAKPAADATAPATTPAPADAPAK